MAHVLCWKNASQLGLKESSSTFSHYSFSTRKRLFSLPTPTRCKLGTTTNLHAQALLSAAQSWNWPPVQPIQESEDQSITPKLLSCFIKASQAYPGSQLVNQFWSNVQRGHTGLKTNIERLKTLPATSVSQQAETLKILFQRINAEEVDFSFVRHFSTQLLAHLGMTFKYQDAPTSELETPDSEDATPFSSFIHFMSKNPNELLKEAAEEDSDETRKQDILKALLFKRDGPKCPLTGASFDPRDPNGCTPYLTQIISNAVHDKPKTLEFIAMLAGPQMRDLIEKNINDIGNIIALQGDAAMALGDLRWAIEAKEDEPNGKVTYIYRKFADKDSPGPGFIKLKDGDEIPFGQGEGKDFEGFPRGPIPALCNLHYRMACVLHMSGAIASQQLYDAADTS